MGQGGGRGDETAGAGGGHAVEDVEEDWVPEVLAYALEGRYYGDAVRGECGFWSNACEMLSSNSYQEVGEFDLPDTMSN